uniref:C-type lectin domain-containing protein n=1 Tax=Acanthochromis polyacanthus TaxID=80966 RepID=A0A3Q1EYX8_9TELE
MDDDLSQNTNWGNRQQTINMCGYVSNNFMLYGRKCFNRLAFYCTNRDTIQFHNKSVNWDTALKLCQNNGSILPTITESNKQNFSFVGWIGLSRENGKNWTWIGNSTSNYTNWAPQQFLPIDCAAFRTNQNKWFSDRCSNRLRFVSMHFYK